ncbi:carbohydrate esterase family 16 protein [Tulasnella calospora MUT 4182]|uniref:Carbohydrate esterase family 16 protein n=1 Tax=Tulasnella calospora MUT 4182 TaxID=1051891 RepID=A0A0C3KDZ5_9AGAM|nr:carbohydrate esterase family 16 protein [Tulasnella calospora MUT 4182]
MDILFELQETLYDRGARNFFFFTVPSLPNASGGRRSLYKDRESRCQAWNQVLKRRIQTEFMTAHPDASVFVFDTWELFERMLTNPTEFGFSVKAGRGFDQEMYWDSIHPTSAVHRVVARAVADFLAGGGVGEDQPEKFVIRPRVAATALEIEL